MIAENLEQRAEELVVKLINSKSEPWETVLLRELEKLAEDVKENEMNRCSDIAQEYGKMERKERTDMGSSGTYYAESVSEAILLNLKPEDINN